MHRLGNLQGAETAYLKFLETREFDHFSSVDPGIVSYKARHNLGLVYEAMARPDLATIGRRAEYIESDEGKLIHRAFVLNDRSAADIMTTVLDCSGPHAVQRAAGPFSR